MFFRILPVKSLDSTSAEELYFSSSNSVYPKIVAKGD